MVSSEGQDFRIEDRCIDNNLDYSSKNKLVELINKCRSCFATDSVLDAVFTRKKPGMVSCYFAR